MQRTMLKSKIHRASVTDADLNYEGSIGIDSKLMEIANILPYEKVDIYNISNGARFSTYAIEADTGVICLNGAAARMAQKGDLIIICSYSNYDESEIEEYRETCILVDSKNNRLVRLL